LVNKIDLFGPKYVPNTLIIVNLFLLIHKILYKYKIHSYII